MPFARAALAIDKMRADFRYVPWGQPSEGAKPPVPGVPERFQRIWFAGNHLDIGGSHPEEESRLSDVAIQWMREQIEGLPHSVRIDGSKLRVFPQAGGRQAALRSREPPRRLSPMVARALRIGWGCTTDWRQ